MEHQERVKKGGSEMLGFYNPNDIDPPYEEPHNYCPYCGEEVLDQEPIFKRKGGDIIGCDHCIKIEWVDLKATCPECGAELLDQEIIYKDGKEIIGCEHCVEECDPYDA